MTNDQINAAIAEACGFIGWEEFQPNKNGPKFRFWDYPKNWTGPSCEPWVPKFCIDLNAMHEAEKVLTQEQITDYVIEVMQFSHEPMLSTARQRAEALLKTLGKWEEVQK